MIYVHFVWKTKQAKRQDIYAETTKKPKSINMTITLVSFQSI